MMDHLGRYSIILIIAGYMVLLSYSWPNGFVPLVAIQSLPLVIFGFLCAVLIVVVFLWFLFAPIELLVDNDFLSDCFGEAFSEGMRSKLKDVSVGELLSDIYKNGQQNIFKVVIVIFTGVVQLVGVLFICFCAWFFLSQKTFTLGYFVIVAVMLFVVYESATNLLKTKKIKGNVLSIIYLVFVFIVLPMFPLNGGKVIVPNVLVKEALSSIAMGGEIPVRIYKDGNAETIEGLLVFYDGSKAWVRQCESANSKAIRVLEVESLMYLNKDRFKLLCE